MDIVGTKELENLLQEEENGNEDISNTENTNEETQVKENTGEEQNDVSEETQVEENTGEEQEDNSGEEETEDVLSDMQDNNEEILNIDEMSDEELEKLLSEIEDSNEEATKEISDNITDENVQLLLKEKDATIKSLSDTIDKYIKENAKMKVKIAEQEAFSEKNPIEIVVARAKSGDKASRDSIIKAAKQFLKEDNIGKEIEAATKQATIKPVVETNEIEVIAQTPHVL